MSFHLVLAPVDHLPEAIEILKHRIVSNGWRSLTLCVILNELHFYFLVQRIVAAYDAAEEGETKI